MIQHIIAIFLICVLSIGSVNDTILITDVIRAEPDLKTEFKIEGIGNGYSSPLVTKDRVIVTGEIDSAGHVFAFDTLGNILWEQTYGPEWMVSYPGARSTPIAVDDFLYICSGVGRIFCFNIENGELRWSVDMVKDLGGINTTYGYSMKLICHEEFLYCSPGGTDHNVVALNRFTGEVLWSSPGFGETAGYGSPIVISLPNRDILVTASEFNIFSLNALTGEILWNYPLSFKGDLPCNTPIYDGTYLYWVAGPGNGAFAVQLSENGSSFDLIWKNKSFDTSFGGFVKIKGWLYAFSNTLREFVALNINSGEIQGKLAFSNGSVIKWEDKLIVYSHSGEIGLINPEQNNLQLLRTFKITEGTGEHFAHPVVNNNRLYIRHGNVLQAFRL